jgi:TusA-related sulfurtransferase
MAVGEVLEVVADDPAAEDDIMSLVKRLRHKLLLVRRVDDVLSVYLDSCIGNTELPESV